MTQLEAFLKVSEQLPIDDPSVLRRLERADRDVLRGYGYNISPLSDGLYRVEKLSTAPLGSSEPDSCYTVSTTSCTCPDFDNARGNLCKHRLAIMILQEMQ